MDVHSGGAYPASKLTNFAPNAFVFRGISCASMEGLLQALKFDKAHMQIHVCTLVGMAAKKRGAKRNWRRDQTLYWQGEELDRHGPEYQQLLDEAYMAMFTQNEGARRALLATGTATLTHAIGKKKESDTVLTEREFCSRLMRCRSHFQALERKR
jgi:predicted NAD-dependent protein-ADP-ribosyltransferase YbiA (DUF1768 family)